MRTIRREEYLMLISDEFAYVVGAYLSDGSAHRHKRNWIVSLTAKDKDFVQSFAYCLKKIQGNSVQVFFQEYNQTWKANLYNKELVLLLWDLTNHKETIPALIKQGSLNTRLMFLAGFLDGDGFVSHNKAGQYQIGFVGTKDWVKNELPELLQSLGICVHKITTRWPKTDWKASLPLHRVGVNVHSFVAAGGFAMIGRKQTRIDRFWAEREATNADKQKRYKRLKNIPLRDYTLTRAKPE